jgi:hypothetical protein
MKARVFENLHLFEETAFLLIWQEIAFLFLYLPSEYF